MNDMSNLNGKFKKGLQKVDIWSLAVGAIIGWGCFVMPGTSFLPKAGPSAIIGQLVAGLIMAVVSLSYGFCIRRYPLSGGEFVYADAAFGKMHAFICGWMLVLGYWSLIPLNSTAIGMITRYLFPGVFQFGHLYTLAGWDVYFGEILLSSLFIVAIGVMNINGVKFAGWFQKIVAITLTIAVAVCLAGVLLKVPSRDLAANLEPFFAQITDGKVEKNSVWRCLVAIAAFAPYCYVGFDCIPQAAEEYNFSHKAAKWLMIGAIMVGACIYAAVIFITAAGSSMVTGTSWGEMMLTNPGWATGESVRAVLGYPGLFFLGIAMLCAVLSGLNAFYLAASRLMYSMSLADALPPVFDQLHPKYGTPNRAILFLMIAALIGPWFGRQTLSWVVDMTCVGTAIGFSYTCGAAFVISKREGNHRQLCISLLGTVFSVFFIILNFIPGSPGFLSIPSFIMLGVWVMIGVIFWVKVRRNFLHGKWEGIDVEHILLIKMRGSVSQKDNR